MMYDLILHVLYVTYLNKTGRKSKIQKERSETTNWKIFTTHTSEKCSHIVHIKNACKSTQKGKQPNNEWLKDLNRHYTKKKKKNTQKTKNHKKRHKVSLIIKESM